MIANLRCPTQKHPKNWLLKADHPVEMARFRVQGLAAHPVAEPRYSKPMGEGKRETTVDKGPMATKARKVFRYFQEKS